MATTQTTKRRTAQTKRSTAAKKGAGTRARKTAGTQAKRAKSTTKRRATTTANSARSTARSTAGTRRNQGSLAAQAEFIGAQVGNVLADRRDRGLEGRRRRGEGHRQGRPLDDLVTPAVAGAPARRSRTAAEVWRPDTHGGSPGDPAGAIL